MTDRSTGNPSDYLAAERTLLAWIRTGLSLMGFGFVVARFGLFLQAMQLGQSNPHARSYGPSFWFGTALILPGVVINMVSARSHVRLVQQLNQGGTMLNRPSLLAVAIAVALSVFGLAITIYLASVREPSQPHLETHEEKPMTLNPGNGIVTIPSRHSVDETIERLESALRAKSVKLFDVIDHSGEAETVGMKMCPTKLVIFGNPKAGTPLMIAAPSVALDLPLKVLVWEDPGGNVWLSHNSPEYLQARHRLPQELVPKIAVVADLAIKAAE